ncbi:MAG TPA: carboxy terminal-processing peptidase [Saprospiraceae bacterium]|nr:carboxy terminal-processing peptidase [Saprospiraceae bacterium]
MRLKPALLLFSFVGILGTVFFLKAFRTPPGDPDPKKEAALMQAILQGVKSLHFQPKAIDDAFSTQVYDLYLKDIDSGKRFFTRRDIDMLQPFREQLDDQALVGTFQFFDISVTLLDQSLTKTQGWYREILANPMDFSKNETLEADGKKLDWAKSDQELRTRWERWMKYEVLSRITEEQDKQEKADYKGEKKDFATLETEQRKKVLDTYDKWYKRMQKLDRMKRLETYLNAITNVFDPHTGYYSPKEKQNFDIQMSGKLEGIGARLQSDGEKTSVTEIVPGGPAWKQGVLQAKDVVLKVAQGDTDAEAVDVMGWDIDDVVSKIRGPKGTRVTLTIQKPDGSEKVITITRDVVLMEEGFAKSLLLRSGADADKVGYIYLPKFYADFTPQGMTSCAADVAKEVEKLKRENVKGIILDLRGNGGGSLRDVVQMSGLFVEDGPIVQVKNRTRKPDVMEDNDNNSVAWSGPFIVMVNGFSASASEILAAAMQDYRRAVIVGSAGTYGKGTVQRFLDLDNATGDDAVKPLGEMKLTIQKFYRVTGKTTQLDGVTPDIVLPDFYNLVDLGERENDHPLESTTIEAVPFNQNAYRIADLAQLRRNSESRVSKDATFQKINENAQRLKRQKDQSQYPLQADKYREWNKKQDEESNKYENMFAPIEGFTVENLLADVGQIQSDTARMARNTDWLKDKKKDIQLYETFNVMQDMIRMDAVAAGGSLPPGKKN